MTARALISVNNEEHNQQGDRPCGYSWVPPAPDRLDETAHTHRWIELVADCGGPYRLSAGPAGRSPEMAQEVPITALSNYGSVGL